MRSDSGWTCTHCGSPNCEAAASCSICKTCAEPGTAVNDQPLLRDQPDVAAVLAAGGAAVYFFSGAYFAFRDEKWPWFMTPPQLDVFAFMFGILGERHAFWGGACLLAALGVGCVLIALKKSMGFIKS